MKITIHKVPLTQVLLFGAIALGASACQAPTNSSQLPSRSGSISEGSKPAVSYPRNPPQLPIALAANSIMDETGD